jgi:hypothetical protein
MPFVNNFTKLALDSGGSLHPLLVPSELTGGTGLMNPSVFVRDGKVCVIVRHVNYTFYHSETKLFQHQFGPLTYIHPENDLHLRTTNYYFELDDRFRAKRITKIDTSAFDNYEPKWDFVGLEDARMFEWEGRLYVSGVRRDTTTNGEGRMELSEIDVTPEAVKEVSRFRIPPPKDLQSYCEKNWMPFLDLPFHYIKWSNPTEVVKVDPASGSSETIFLGEHSPLGNDLRGGSQVISWGDKYLAVVHEVDLFKSEAGRKDGVYRHRFVVWEKNFRRLVVTEPFFFMDAHVEFCVGLAAHGEDLLMTFGFQDNAAYILRCPKKVVNEFVFGTHIRSRIDSWPRHIVLGGNDATGGLEQNAYELEMLCEFIKDKGIKTYMEVGIAAGLLLKFMREEMGLDTAGITLEKRPTHINLPVIYGRSDDPSIVEVAPHSDLYFIDADHSYEAVKTDYMNYRGKCRFMAFHDILGLRDCEGVARLWGEIKGQYEHWEFFDSNRNIASGIGVIKIR